MNGGLRDYSQHRSVMIRVAFASHTSILKPDQTRTLRYQKKIQQKKA